MTPLGEGPAGGCLAPPACTPGTSSLHSGKARPGTLVGFTLYPQTTPLGGRGGIPGEDGEEGNSVLKNPATHKPMRGHLLMNDNHEISQKWLQPDK